jgi:hypothetical protein
LQAELLLLEPSSWKDTIEKCIQQILSFQQHDGHNMKIIGNVREQCDPNQDILSCASCGETFAEKRDKIKGKRQIGYMHPLSDLNIMRLSEEEAALYWAMDPNYRCIQGIYPHQSQAPSILYHLHPQFITIPDGQQDNLDNHVACLCLRCHDGLESQVPYLYKYSLAKGFDYGDIRRLPAEIGFRELNMAEKIVTTKSMPYSIILKLAIQHVGQRLKLASHVITFPSGGMEALSDHATNTLPHPPDVVKQVLRVNIIGAGTFAEIRSSLLMGKSQVTVEATAIYKFLR